MYKLMIVDDEPVIRNGIKSLIDFSLLDIDQVYEACDGAEALKAIKENQPDIVLADINMPNMDGLELVRTVKQLDRAVKVAIITGYDYFDYAVAALKAGVDDFVLKPVSRNDIQELLRKLVSMRREEDNRRHALESAGTLKKLKENERNEDLEYKNIILGNINDNLSNPEFSLSILAKSISLSQGYLSTLFKNIFGIPFQDFLISMRLERSKILLLSTSCKIYEIAEKVGFDDPNYFSTSFRKHFGLSPNQFRNSKTGGLQ